MKRINFSRSNVLLYAVILLTMLACKPNPDNIELEIDQNNLPDLEKQKILIRGSSDYYAQEYELTLRTKESIHKIVFDSL